VIIDEGDLLNGMVLLKGYLSAPMFTKVFRKLVYDKETKTKGILGPILPFVATPKEDHILSQYVGIKWCTGGSKRKAYIEILRSHRGIEKKIKNELGELTDE